MKPNRSFYEMLGASVSTALVKAYSYEEERRRAEALAELDRSKTIFFSNVSHEFRTPLTLMLGPLAELKDRFASPELSDATDTYQQLSLIHRNSLRLLKLVNTLLDFSRIEAGRMQAAYEATDLAEYTKDLTSVFGSATEKAGLQLIISCPPCPELVYVDRQMWEKIVINLLSNAFKHTFSGEIEVSLGWYEKNIKLEVHDTGIGIAEAELEHVFDRFHRVQNVRSRSHEGTGIGLALVRELVHLHGGEVRVSSQVGVGSTFSVVIPTGTAHLQAEYIHPTQVVNPQLPGVDFFMDEASRWKHGVEGENYLAKQTDPDKVQALIANLGSHILLADDNADMRSYVGRLLQEQGYAVTAVGDGEAALAAVREQHPNLVLTDIMMPGLDGLGLLSALREDQETSTIPIILLSARAGEEERIAGLKHGADSYLTKPFSAKELLARVGACLEVSRLRNLAEAQLRLAENEREFRSLAETMPQIVWSTQTDGLASYFNHKWVDYTGLTLEKSYGHGWITPFHPDDKQRAWDAWQRATQQNASYSLECRLRRVDGVYRWWLIRGVPLLNEAGEIQKWYGTCTDIQDLKQQAEELKIAETRWQFALEGSSQGVWDWDLTTNIVFFSKQWKAMLGFAEHEISGRYEDWLERVHPEDLPTALAAVDNYLGGESDFFELEHRLLHKNGKYLWTQSRGMVVSRDEDGKPLRMIGVQTDISKQHQLYAELRQHRDHLEMLVASRTTELEASKALADAANRSKSAFLANMSHEIRTPMSAILGLTHFLQRENPNPVQRDRLDKIDAAGKHLLSIINDILDLSKIEAGHLVLEKVDFSLTAVLDQVSNFIEEQAQCKGLTLEIDTDSVPLWLKGDPTRLRQSLLNYASNAVKFTEQGTISLSARLLREDAGGLLLLFEVRDTGPGIAKEKLATLFNAFEQADVSTTRKYGGTGLGLAITRRLAGLMGGEAGVTSQLGRGSTFWFTAYLERGQEQAAEEPLLSEETTATELRKHTGARLLLAEDNPINREVALELLSDFGLSVDIAEDGLQAVAKVRTQTYALILMDVQMPKMDGMEATKIIRTLYSEAELPILAMTANAFNDDRAACLKAGMNDFVAKPVEPKIFYATVAKWLSSSVTKRNTTADHENATLKPDWQQQLLEIPGLDVQRGLNNMGGKMTTYLRVLQMLVEQHGADPQRIKDALAKQDVSEVKYLAHKLKGAIGNLGATRIETQAGAIDLAISQGTEQANLEPLCNELSQELAMMIKAVQNVLAAADYKLDL